MMKRMHVIWQRLKIVAVAVALWLVLHAEVLAAPKKMEPPVKEGPGSQAWVFPYFVVLMAVGLGMLMVCLSSRRADRAKPRQYGSVVET